MKKIIRRLLLLLLLIALGWAVRYAWVSFPIISGFDAKQACTCIFVSGRNEAALDTTEMAEYPLSLASYKVNRQEASVTASVLGMATQKAIYRPGIGCTLVNGATEKAIRAQQFALPSPSTDTLPWPYGEETGDTLPAGLAIAGLQKAVAAAFDEPEQNKKRRTRAVVVVHKGQIVAEQYASGFTQHTPMYGWSMAKSITSALIGTLVQAGRLNIAQPAPVPEWQLDTDPRHTITTRHLLQQRSGLQFVEDYSKASDVTNMLYKEGNMAAFAAAHPLANTPGDVFYYSSGNSNILSRIIRHTVGEQAYAAYPFTALFYKIGMHHSLLEPDASGTYVGSSYVCATARDYARFGLLYLQDGVWNGERILPAGWVQESITPAPAITGSAAYGYQFWLNSTGNGQRVIKSAPTDLFYADGYAGQRIYIIPSLSLVVVRLGLTLDKSFNDDDFLNSIIKNIKSDG